MRSKRIGRPLRGLRTTIVALVAMLAALAWTATAMAAPATQVWTGQETGTTPDIEELGLDILNPAGTPISGPDRAGSLNFTLNGAAYVGVCIDLQNPFNLTDSVPVDVTSTMPAAGTDDAALAWIIGTKLPTGGDPADSALQRQAAVAQVAAWLIADAAQVNTTTPTSNADINAAAIALVAEARAVTATPASLSITAATPVAGAVSTTVTITGRAGAVVDLTPFGGTLSANRVTLDASGRATVTLSKGAGAEATVDARTAGDFTLLRIIPKDHYGKKNQATATVKPNVLEASTHVAFTPAPTTPPAPPAPPVTPPTVTPPLGAVQGTPAPRVTRRAVLRINKTGPARARGLSRVTYRIVVRNTGKAVARNVVVRDHLPKGLAHVRSPKGTFRKGVVTFRLGNLRPGARKVVRVIVQAPSNARGRKLNVATVRAAGLRPVRDTAPTMFRPLVLRVKPAVTG